MYTAPAEAVRKVGIPLTLWPARSPSRLATLYTESSDSFVASAAVSIASGWSEPVPGREFHPLKSSAFSRRTITPVAIIRAPMTKPFCVVTYVLLGLGSLLAQAQTHNSSACVAQGAAIYTVGED